MNKEDKSKFLKNIYSLGFIYDSFSIVDLKKIVPTDITKKPFWNLYNKFQNSDIYKKFEA